jgi:acetyl-CoA acetyltransferase
MTDYTVQIVDDYVQPTTPLATNEDYVTFVMNMAAESYMNQYGTDNVEDGVTAAREAFNAALPPAAEE